MASHECVFANNENLLESIEDSKDMVCMTRNMDKVKETCEHLPLNKVYFQVIIWV